MQTEMVNPRYSQFSVNRLQRIGDVTVLQLLHKPDGDSTTQAKR